MRIALVISSLQIGGAERQAAALARALSRRHRVQLLTVWGGGPLEGELKGSSVELVDLGRRGRLDLRFLWRLAEHIRRHAPDVLYAWLPQVNLISVISKLVRPATRLAWSVVDAGTAQGPLRADVRLVNAIEPRLARVADVVITNSEAGTRYARARGFPPSKLVLVRNGIDVERFHGSPGARERLRAEWGFEDAFVVGTVARLDPIKDHPTLLRAAALALKERADLGFVLVGGGDSSYVASLTQLAEALGIRERVRLLGPRSDVSDVLASLDAAALTSVAEGFPNAVGEAMASGLPCLVTDVGDCAHLVGQSGFVVPPGDPVALRGALLRLATLPSQEREALGRAARERVSGLFSVESMAGATEAVFSSLLGG
ncbi:MAG: glycosyltransferase [Anaeromyxobacteraceae bacterium]